MFELQSVIVCAISKSCDCTWTILMRLISSWLSNSKRASRERFEVVFNDKVNNVNSKDSYSSTSSSSSFGSPGELWCLNRYTTRSLQSIYGCRVSYGEHF